MQQAYLEGFAAVYDRLMQDVDYEAWADHYAALFKRGALNAGEVLDAACGTGNMTLPLARRGYRVTGCDLSEQMLSAAQEKARAARLPIRFARQSLTQLALPHPVDAIVCACDGVNYLTTPEQVKAFFRCARANLKPGGLLAFDVSTRYKLAKVLDGNCFGEDLEDIAYLWRNSYNSRNHCVAMDLSIFIREGTDYRRYTETHIQRGHLQGELTRWLAQSGLSVLGVWGERGFQPPKPRDQRLHILARNTKEEIR